MILLLLTLNLAQATDDVERNERGERVVYRNKTEIDFEDLEIEGILQKPQSALVLERKKAQFNPLIQLRLNFNPEIEQSVDDIK